MVVADSGSGYVLEPVIQVDQSPEAAGAGQLADRCSTSMNWAAVKVGSNWIWISMLVTRGVP